MGLPAPRVALGVEVTSRRCALHIGSSGSGDVDCDSFAVPLIQVVLDLLPHGQRPEPRGLDRRLMHEHVAIAVRGNDEPEALL